MSDGKIRISAKILTDGAKKGFELLKQTSAKTAKAIRKDFDDNVQQLDKQSLAIKNLKQQYDLLASGDIAPASLKAMESELKHAQKEAIKLQEILNQQESAIDIQGEIASRAKTKMNTNPNQANTEYYETAKQKLADLVAENAKLGRQFDALNQKCLDLPEKIASIRLNPENSIEAQNLADKIKLLESALNDTEKRTASLKDKLLGLFKLKLGGVFGGKEGELKKNFEGIGSKIDKLKNRITKLAGAAFVFNILRQGLASLASGMKNLISGNADFANSLNQIKVNLMTAFAPIYNVALPAINALMSALSKITGAIAVFISSLFGKTVSQAKNSANALYAQSQALNAVGESAKNAEGALASFDNLEVNDSSKNASNNSGGSGGLDFNNEIVWDEGFLNFLNKCKDVLATLFEPFKVAWTSQGAKVIESLRYALSSVKDLALDIGRTFLEVWSGGLGEQIAENLLGIWLEINLTIGNIAKSIKKAWDENGRGKKLIESILATFNKALELVCKIAEKLKEFALSPEFQTGIEKVFEILTKVFDIIGGIAGTFETAFDINGYDMLIALQGILDEIFSLVDNIAGTIRNWVLSEDFQNAILLVSDAVKFLIEKVREFAEWIAIMYEQYIKPVLEEKIIPAINSIIEAVSKVWEFIKPIIDFIVELLKTYLEPQIHAVCVAIGFIADAFKFVADLISAVVDGDITKAFESFDNLAQGTWDAITGIFSGIDDWFGNIFEQVKEVVGVVWDWMKNAASGAWEGIKQVFGGVANWFGDIFRGAWEKVKQVFSTGGQIFTGIKDGIVNAFTTVVNAIIGGLNKVISVPFNTINGILNGIRNIGILDFKPFQGLWGYNPLAVPQIPKLATGGIAYAPMVAQIGEYAGARSNPEIVTPENLMRQIVREESSSDKSVVIDNLTLVTKIGEETLQKQVIRGIRLEEQMIGRPLFVS